MASSQSAASDTQLASLGRTYVVENHDEAYTIWREAGVQGRVIVHVDVHHDLYGTWKGSATSPITIANYLFAAIEAGIVRQIIWVVPDDAWEQPRRRRAIQQQLAAIDGCSLERESLARPGLPFSGVVFGVPLTVCDLGNLPSCDEAVLLDIDVDYLVDPGVDGTRHGDLPWCWPEDLTNRLHERGVTWDLATIAYSVEGGYTPLQWKYLGDEIAQRLMPFRSDQSLSGMAEMRSGATEATRRNFAAACIAYDKARSLMPSCAAPEFHLAYVNMAMGQLDAGRAHYRAAMSIDPSYRTAFNSQALWYYECGRPADAERAFRHVLRVDPDDAWAHLGLGTLAADARRWKESEACVRRALAINVESVDAWRTLAESLEQQGRLGEAEAAYERSLKLGLLGRPSIHDRMIVTRASLDELSDPHHALTHVRLGRLHARQGNLKIAIQGLRMGITLGVSTSGTWMELARLHARDGEWRKTIAAGWMAITLLPETGVSAIRRMGYRIRRAPASALRRTRAVRSSSGLWD